MACWRSTARTLGRAAAEDYVAGPSGHVPFVRTVAEWIRELAGDGLREADGLAMVTGGRLVDDIYFTVNLDGLRAALPAAEADRTAAEAADARRLDGDAGVLGAGHDLGALTLDDASRRNHGAAFHERFIAAMCRKIHPGGAAAVPAALRRKVWMPLFHPRTLRPPPPGAHRLPAAPPRSTPSSPAASGRLVDGAAGAYPRRPPRPGGRDRPPGAGGGRARRTCPSRLDDGLDWDARRPVLGTGAPELFAAVGAGYDAPRLPMSIAWAEVDERDVLALPALVHVPDADIDAFRISPGDRRPPGAAP